MPAIFMKALSIKQPWASLIAWGWKDVENRTRRTNFRGRFLIHASKSCTPKEWDYALEFIAARSPDLHKMLMQDSSFKFDALPRGAIIGSAEIVDCVEASVSRWFVGDYGYVIKRAALRPIVPYKGMLGFFNVPEITA
jgi:hypothetical protein